MFFLRLSLKTDFKRRFRFKLDPLILKKTEYRICKSLSCFSIRIRVLTLCAFQNILTV